MPGSKPATHGADRPVVKVAPEARDEVEAWGARENYTRPGMLIRRQGAKGDVSRAPDGRASWTIDRSEPWCAEIRDFARIEKSADIQWDNGLPYWLIHRLLPGEVGLYVTVHDGRLFVESLDA